MKIHSTNFYNTFVEIADDCPVQIAEVPKEREGDRTVARIQFDMIVDHPYQYTSDDVLFHVYAEKNNIPKRDYKEARAFFFSKGQACFRASPLTKRYGWGVHNDDNGKIALFAMDSKEYQEFIANSTVVKVKAMSTKKVKK